MNPVVAAAAIGAGASLLGSAGTAAGNAAMSKRQMDWQEKMSNTAYQRAAKDLEAAGLNRILAIGSPATTPGGSVAQFPDFGSSMAQGANAGINLQSSASTISKQKQETEKLLKETGIANEKLLQEMAKTPVIQEVAKPIAKGANSVNQITSHISQAIPDFIFEIGNWSRAKLEAFDQMMRHYLTDYEGSRYQIIVRKARKGVDKIAPNPFYEHEDIKIGN